MNNENKTVETPEVEGATVETPDDASTVETPEATPEVETPALETLDYESMYNDEHNRVAELEKEKTELINKYNGVVKMYNERFKSGSSQSSLPTPEVPEKETEESKITIDELIFGKDD